MRNNKVFNFYGAVVAVALFIFVFSSCSTHYRLSGSQQTYHRIDKKLDSIPETGIALMIEPYKNELAAIMDEVIGYSAGLSKTRPESTMGNWVSDALEKFAVEKTGQDIAFAAQNYGGLRINEVPEGPITRGKIFELMPFENFLTIMTVEGSIVQEFLDRIAAYGGWPVSGSLQFRIEDSKAADIFIKGIPFDINATYILALPDYVANGGDGSFFFEPIPKEHTEYLIRDILIDEVIKTTGKNEAIKANIEGRIR
jgi:2',3'-cyclic-nucleotide 2'-phosphodiesterase (5'-nucleotidase family)